MPAPRKPAELARITGASAKNPARYAGRNEPTVDDPLGDPPAWIVDRPDCLAQSAWRSIAVDVPWLNRSHRTLVAIACQPMGRMMAGEDVGFSSMNLLRQCLGQMGATPADASKVPLPTIGGDDDPTDEFFN